jgi:spermidine synthase
LACYAQPGQTWTFFEIDPVVVEIARQRFTYLSTCTPDATMVTGDARLTLQAQPAGSFDLLAVDAFSSDAIPLHLMTLEALVVYGQALGPDGLLLIHISNRFLDLEPVLARLAATAGWHGAHYFYKAPAELVRTAGGASSNWIALSRQPQRIAQLRAANPGWTDLRRTDQTPLWQDDFASVLPALRW